MNVTRPRCPVCGTRLNQGTLEREVEFGDDRDVITQDIGGRGSISTTRGCSFESPDGIEYAKEFYEKIKPVYEYLRKILEIDEKDDEG